MEQILPMMELELFDDRADAPPKADAEVDAVTGLCPEGHGLMTRARVVTDDTFFLDRCIGCGGIWFDRGEWEKVASAHLVEEIAAFWTKAWQSRQRETSRQKEYLQ